jgi:hypothetical protein
MGHFLLSKIITLSSVESKQKISKNSNNMCKKFQIYISFNGTRNECQFQGIL